MHKIMLAEKENVREVVSLLNETTLNFHEKGINQWTYPWDENIIKKDVENKRVYILLYGNEIAGTFSLKDIDSSWFEFVKRNSIYLYRIAVLPKYQGKGAGHLITNYACKFAKNMNKTLYLDCWSGNVKLKDFYTGAGFKLLGDFPEDDYKISIFIFE